jgi:16S rRNA (uracil1498-N3)-methyltransferase
MNEKKSIAIFIGPEGGWNSDEIQLFHSANFEVKNLGQQIFRAETAVICAIFSVVSL